MEGFVGGSQLEAMVSDEHLEVRIAEGFGTDQRSVVRGQRQVPRSHKRDERDESAGHLDRNRAHWYDCLSGDRWYAA